MIIFRILAIGFMFATFAISIPLLILYTILFGILGLVIALISISIDIIYFALHGYFETDVFDIFMGVVSVPYEVFTTLYGFY